MATREYRAFTKRANRWRSCNLGKSTALGTSLIRLLPALVFFPASLATAGPLDIVIGARDIAPTPVEQGTKFVSPLGSGNQSGVSPANAMPFQKLDLWSGSLREMSSFSWAESIATR